VLKRTVSGIVLFFLSASGASAATYYVRTDGNNANVGTANASSGAWLTITFAGQHVSAGDTIRVQSGTYVETASGIISGTAGNPTTLVADGSVTTCGMSFSSKNYIRVVGFIMNPNASSCGGHPSPIVSTTGTNTGLEFWNNDIGNLAGKGLGTFNATDRCNKCIIIGGSVHDITNGNTAISLLGDDAFVGYVKISGICYVGVGPSGARGRFVNLNFSGMIQCNSLHPDFFYIDGAGQSTGFSNSLVESTLGIGTVTSTDNKYFHAENQSPVAWTDDVWRFNVSYNTGSASSFSMYADSGGNTLTRWRFYNNTATYGDRALSGDQICGNIQNNGGGPITYYVYNSVFYQCWSDNATTSILPWSNTNPVARDYNLGFTPLGSVSWASNWTSQLHQQTNIDPKLTNTSNQDFTLQSSSPARGTGGPLTTTSGSGTSSTTLTVAASTGSFFIGDNSPNLAAYGGKLVPGDFITVGSTTVQVSSVSGDTLTLRSPISWASGAPVYFGSSSTVDIGAYPYKAGGYALSAGYSMSGGIATITPNDPSLVRFVVCYSDNVPYAVTNGVPYTCPAPIGTFSARVYPRYASQTQGVNALFGNGPPAAPTGVAIIR